MNGLHCLLFSGLQLFFGPEVLRGELLLQVVARSRRLNDESLVTLLALLQRLTEGEHLFRELPGAIPELRELVCLGVELCALFENQVFLPSDSTLQGRRGLLTFSVAFRGVFFDFIEEPVEYAKLRTRAGPFLVFEVDHFGTVDLSHMGHLIAVSRLSHLLDFLNEGAVARVCFRFERLDAPESLLAGALLDSSHNLSGLVSNVRRNGLGVSLGSQENFLLT